MKKLEPTQDEYGEIYNSEETFTWISEALLANNSVLIGWTDQEGTHYDILFSFDPAIYYSKDTMASNSRTFQSGIKPNDLFVSVMRRGAFAFKLTDIGTHPAYYSEKLGVSSEQFSDLVNAVRKKLYES